MSLLTLPSVEDRLYRLTQVVLAGSAFLAADPAEVSANSDQLPLQYMAHLTGHLSANVGFRADLAAARLLATSMTGEATTDAEAADAFKEFSNQVCGHILTEFWSHGDDFEPFMPSPCRAIDWPVAEPLVSCFITVEGTPVEIHLWAASVDAPPSAS